MQMALQAQRNGRNESTKGMLAAWSTMPRFSHRPLQAHILRMRGYVTTFKILGFEMKQGTCSTGRGVDD
jgi:hypothetical protein